jgi:hypothetical protein
LRIVCTPSSSEPKCPIFPDYADLKN